MFGDEQGSNDVDNNDFKLKDNGVLLISEIQNKVILPYTTNEIIDIFNNNVGKYKSTNEIIEKIYTKELSYYKYQFSARFKEAMNLMVKKEKMSYIEGLNLATELLGKKYLHPAIIAACKNLNELNVYLDCLDKNELDDFKIFEIKYELYPMVVKKDFNLVKKTNLLQKIIRFFKNILISHN